MEAATSYCLTNRGQLIRLSGRLVSTTLIFLINQSKTVPASKVRHCFYMAVFELKNPIFGNQSYFIKIESTSHHIDISKIKEEKHLFHRSRRRIRAGTFCSRKIRYRESEPPLKVGHTRALGGSEAAVCSVIEGLPGIAVLGKIIERCGSTVFVIGTVNRTIGSRQGQSRLYGNRPP